MDNFLPSVIVAIVCGIVAYATYVLVVSPRFNPLLKLAGPPTSGFFSNNLADVLSPSVSPRVHELYVQQYGRSVRIRGVGPWDERLLTLDPVSVAHVLKNSTIYEKPWQSRKLITSLIGCGMLAAEGQVHKRQRRVATPAFSVQNMRALLPLVFKKGTELKDKWMEIVDSKQVENNTSVIRVDVCHWISRATFDVIGLAGFGYHFNAIQNESNELFNAYKEMFEVAISQGGAIRTAIAIYVPVWNTLFPNDTSRTVSRCQEVIHRVAGHLIQEKKRRIVEGETTGSAYDGKDLLSLLLKSNVAVDLPTEQRISDEDILHNINTFMFAGSDTSSLSLTWTLLLLAQHPQIQERLRAELFSVAPEIAHDVSDLTEDEIQSVFGIISTLPFLHNVIRESIRLIPPVHSSIRVATQDDEIPTMYPVRRSDGTIDPKRSVSVPKGSFVHVAVEGFNLDKEFWGEDAWKFNPDRWDSLPDTAQQLPGLFSNTLTFSAGPRSCIGLRFSMIEIKSFLYILLTHFIFHPTEDKILRSNVVLTRPYIAGKYKDGSQCPMLVTPYLPELSGGK